MIWVVAPALLAVLIALVILNRISDKTYVHKVLVYLDVFVCALITRDPAITLSSYAGLSCRWRASMPNSPGREPIPTAPLGWRILYRVLNTLQRNHCELAIRADLARAENATVTLRHGL